VVAIADAERLCTELLMAIAVCYPWDVVEKAFIVAGEPVLYNVEWSTLLWSLVRTCTSCTMWSGGRCCGVLYTLWSVGCVALCLCLVLVVLARVCYRYCYRYRS